MIDTSDMVAATVESQSQGPGTCSLNNSILSIINKKHNNIMLHNIP